MWSEILIGIFLESNCELNMDQQDRRPQQLFHPSPTSQTSAAHLFRQRSYTRSGVSFRNNQAFVTPSSLDFFKRQPIPFSKQLSDLFLKLGYEISSLLFSNSLHWLSIKLYIDYKPCLRRQYGAYRYSSSSYLPETHDDRHRWSTRSWDNVM